LPALTREREVREAYAAHSGELYGFAVRSLGDAGLAEEAVQQAFLRAWRQRDRFGPTSGSLRSLLFAILREILIDLSRSRPPADDIEPSTEQLEQALVAWQVEEAMRRIDEQHRQVLVETFYRGRPSADLATELGVPVETVKSRVLDGLRTLKAALDEVTSER